MIKFTKMVSMMESCHVAATKENRRESDGKKRLRGFGITKGKLR